MIPVQPLEPPLVLALEEDAYDVPRFVFHRLQHRPLPELCSHEAEGRLDEVQHEAPLHIEEQYFVDRRLLDDSSSVPGGVVCQDEVPLALVQLFSSLSEEEEEACTSDFFSEDLNGYESIDRAEGDHCQSSADSFSPVVDDLLMVL